jgi:hypothetical protein
MYLPPVSGVSGGGNTERIDMRCSAITKRGEACKNTPPPGREFCPAHDPAHERRRTRDAARGGRIAGNGRTSPISAELARLQAVFKDLAADILEGHVDRGAAAVAIQALNGARGCVVGALKAKEQKELARELEELKALIESEGRNRWRA